MKLRIVLLILITGLLFISCDKEDSFYFEGDWEVENPYITFEEGSFGYGDKQYNAQYTVIPGQISIKNGAIYYYYFHTYLRKSDNNLYSDEGVIDHEDALLYKFRFEDPHIYFSDFNWYDLVSSSKDRMVWRELETGKEFILNRKKQ